MQNQKGRAVVATVGLVWLLAGAGDWFMRFYWFHWQQLLVSRPAAMSGGPFVAMQRTELQPWSGGDLSSLVGIDSVAAPLKDERPSTLELTDEAGYRNAPGTATGGCPVVVTGSSFMNSGYPMTNMFSARLASILGVPVYNHAFPGRGPFQGLIRFLQDERFKAKPPKVLVWGVVEREIGGEAFGGLLYQMEWLERSMKEDRPEPAFFWQGLSPAMLKATLPNTSSIAQASRRVWTWLRFRALGQLNPEIAVSTGSWTGEPFLFYTPAVHALKWTPAQRDVTSVANDIRIVADHLRARGVLLMMLLIPDKEQVYKEYLPAYLNHPGDPVPPSCLDGLEQRLHEEGIPVVNMLEPYRARAATGQLLYWRDDTHWNADAVAMAAEACHGELSKRLTLK